MLFSSGGPEKSLSPDQLRQGLCSALDQLGSRSRVLIVPPDITRCASRGGELTRYAYDYYGSAISAILPALGTHRPMSTQEIGTMFGDLPQHLFREHDWRNDVVTLGEISGAFVASISGGKLSNPWPVQINRMLIEGSFDLILSIGQVVPHEVAGMANQSKNILVGLGGKKGIDGSHFLGAVCGMERIMGRIDNPVRTLFSEASKRFLSHLPIVYVLTVVDCNGCDVRGLFVGPDESCFREAAGLSQKVNITFLDAPIKKAIVYLAPREYKSAWLGNKAIYRTRMAMADKGELIVMGPGVERFGEDERVDRLIRTFGYFGTKKTLDAMQNSFDLQENPGVAAHLIHGSDEGRFSVTWCPGGLTQQEIEYAGFRYGDVASMLKKYDPAQLHAGAKSVDGEEIFFVPNPGLGLWALRGAL